MSTRSCARNLFQPLDHPELTIRRRSRTDHTLLNDSEMVAEGNGDLPVPDLRTMEELCHPSLNGRGGPIAPIAIQATNIRLKNDMIQQVQNSCQFYGLSGDDANKHLDKFLHVTQSIKQMAKMFLGKYFPPSMVTKLRNEITNFHQRLDESLFEAWERYKLSIDQCPNHNMFLVTQIDTFYNGLTLRHRDTINVPSLATLKTYMLREPIKIPQPQVVTTNEFTNFMKANDVILKNMQTNMTSLTNSNLELKNMFGQFMKMNTASSSRSETLPERDTEVTKDTMHPTNNGSTKDLQPSVVLTESPIFNFEPVVTRIIEHVASPVSALKPNQRPLIPYPSRLHDQKLRDKANDQREKFFEIFKN
nr:hypothetical protein [Tanacetum cinerariifolium]